MLLKAETGIGPEETAVELAARLAEMGAELLVRTLEGLAAGAIVPEKQDAAQATYAPLLKKEDGPIDWSQPAAAIHNRVRGLQPWPGAYTAFRGQALHIWRARRLEMQRRARTADEREAAGGGLRRGRAGTGRSAARRPQAHAGGGFRERPAAGGE